MAAVMIGEQNNSRERVAPPSFSSRDSTTNLTSVRRPSVLFFLLLAIAMAPPPPPTPPTALIGLLADILGSIGSGDQFRAFSVLIYLQVLLTYLSDLYDILMSSSPCFSN